MVLDRLGESGGLAHSAPPLDRVVVKEANRIFFVRTGEIDWIEAAGNYVRLHTAHQVHVIRRTLDALERRLGGRFVRIRRSMLGKRRRHHRARALRQGGLRDRAAERAALDVESLLPAQLKALLTG